VRAFIGAPAAPVKFFLQIGPGLLRTNSEQKAWNMASSGRTIAGFASEYVQPFSTFCTNEANGESVTKTMLQHEQYNQRGYNTHIRAKTALLIQVNGRRC
jgi:hypothetical protein